MSRRRPHTCQDPGPGDTHCTSEPGHRWSCYDAGQDESWNDRQDWLTPHACDDDTCPRQGHAPDPE